MKITTLEQLADFINSKDDWNLEVNRVISTNGWADDSGEDYGICTDQNGRRLVLNEHAEAVIIEK